jgi:hypothetical protein
MSISNEYELGRVNYSGFIVIQLVELRTLLTFSLGMVLFIGALLLDSMVAHADLLNWPHQCPPGPPGLPYFFTTTGTGANTIVDSWPAHFQTSPVAGPSGGNCSLDVVSGSVVSTPSSTGGIDFATRGEVAGATYTLAFDMQWVKGTSGWSFSNQNGGGGVQNGLTFAVPYPGDCGWRHYEYTAPVGPIGPENSLFVYQDGPVGNRTGLPGEMRIANMTLNPASQNAAKGLVAGKAAGSTCCPQTNVPGEAR